MNQENVIRVLIADDNAFVREGLASLINQQKYMQVCAQAENGEEVVCLFRQQQPDVTIMDLHMPHMSGCRAKAFICQEFPGAYIVGFAAFAESDEVTSFLRAGAKTCVSNVDKAAALFHAIRASKEQSA